MDLLALYRAERSESVGLTWVPGSWREKSAPSPDPAGSSSSSSSSPSVPRPEGAPLVGLSAPSPTAAMQFFNASRRAGSTPEGLAFWFGEG